MILTKEKLQEITDEANREIRRENTKFAIKRDVMLLKIFIYTKLQMTARFGRSFVYLNKKTLNDVLTEKFRNMDDKLWSMLFEKAIKEVTKESNFNMALICRKYKDEKEVVALVSWKDESFDEFMEAAKEKERIVHDIYLEFTGNE